MGLSLTLFGLASLPLAFERTCALPAPVPAQMVQAGLALLAVANDAARKNAALFFDAAVHYPVLLECFDSNDGLHRLLYPLQHVVQLLQAGGPAELRAERQVRERGGCVAGLCACDMPVMLFTALLVLACSDVHTSWQLAVVVAYARCCPLTLLTFAVLWRVLAMRVGVCMQVAYHASRALLQYARAHLVIHLTALQRRLRDGQVRVG